MYLRYKKKDKERTKEMRTDMPGWVNPAMKVIKTTDLDLYNRMEKCDWEIKVIATPEDLEYILVNDGPAEYMSLLGDMASSFGVTDTAPDGQGRKDQRNTTWINKPDTIHAAENAGIPLPEFLAFILVHEFNHREFHSEEIPAFAAGERFAEKLRSPELVEINAQIRESEVGDPYYDPEGL